MIHNKVRRNIQGDTAEACKLLEPRPQTETAENAAARSVANVLDWDEK